MTEAEVDALCVTHGNDIVLGVLAGLASGAPLEQITVLIVHRTARAHDEIAHWCDAADRRALGDDGFLCCMPRSEAREALTADGMPTAARALDVVDGTFTLVVLFGRDACVRHIEVERVDLSLNRPRTLHMVKGGSA